MTEPTLSQAELAPKPLTLRSAVFRKSREKSWEKLDKLITQLDRRGLKALSAQEAMELPLLYQSAVSSLALARHISLDQSLRAYLESLVLRGYIAVYGPRQSFEEILGSFFARDFPRAVRRLKWPILIAALALISGLLTGFFQVLADPAAFHHLVSEDLAGGRGPNSSPQFLLEEVIFAPWPGFEKSFIVFASYLFEHNSFVTFLAFGLGFALGAPTVVILFQNGQILGAMLAIHWSKDIALEFIGWVAIHGVTELTAVVLAGAAGLGVAERIFFPGERSRLENLAREGPTAVAAMVGVIFMLLLAGLIEGGFRQLVGSTPLRLFFAGLSLFGWLYYFLFFGREDDA
ncbi:MAG: stage II sporulation protein M [Deltaproteobacteria bacterium]|jgi:uncharacterized membrane protein SpoIIM required for sporulation|nr:stage II sporulation protein M [Deltaproteobacteria bacterium]